MEIKQSILRRVNQLNMATLELSDTLVGKVGDPEIDKLENIAIYFAQLRRYLSKQSRSGEYSIVRPKKPPPVPRVGEGSSEEITQKRFFEALASGKVD